MLEMQKKYKLMMVCAAALSLMAVLTFTGCADMPKGREDGAGDGDKVSGTEKNGTESVSATETSALAEHETETAEPQSGEAESPEKVYCTATLEDSFADDKILIIVFSDYNNKEYGISGFEEIGCAEVREISPGADSGEPSRILVITLDKHSKENVLDSIKKLETRRDIYCAEPDYTGWEPALDDD